MNPFLIGILVLLWLYFLHALKKAELFFWRFLVGSLGMFAILITTLQPVFTMPLARSVSALAGVVGDLTHSFTAYFKYGVIYVPTAASSITLQVDFECSGLIEILAFLSLLTFFDVYSVTERVMAGIGGFCYIMLCNTLRIVMICLSVHFFGPEAYAVMHAFVGRIVFYILSILLYFYVFTKPQVVRMTVGKFTYGYHKKTS